jgi:hypothetical protein
MAFSVAEKTIKKFLERAVTLAGQISLSLPYEDEYGKSTNTQQ